MHIWHAPKKHTLCSQSRFFVGERPACRLCSKPIRNHSTRSIQKIPGKYPPNKTIKINLNPPKSPMFLPSFRPQWGKSQFAMLLAALTSASKAQREARPRRRGWLARPFSVHHWFLNRFKPCIKVRFYQDFWWLNETIVFWFCMSYHEIQRVPVICPFKPIQRIIGFMVVVSFLRFLLVSYWAYSGFYNRA